MAVTTAGPSTSTGNISDDYSPGIEFELSTSDLNETESIMFFVLMHQIQKLCS